MINGVATAHLNAEAAKRECDELTALYEAVWLSGWKNGDPFFSRERFVDRLNAHLAAPGFELVTARLDGKLIGYMYGFSRPANHEFAVCELMVASKYRRNGVAGVLHDELLGGRSERTAQLLVEKQNLAAQAAYRRWGWNKIADYQPFPDSPDYDSLALVLQDSA